MYELRKVAIAIDTFLNLDQLELYSSLDFIRNCDITLVHIVREVVASDGISFNVAFPDFGEKEEFRIATLDKLEKLSLSILPTGFSGNIHFECLFALDPVDSFCTFLSNEKFELAIVASFEHHHLFDISFSDKISKKAICDVMVMKSRLPMTNKIVVGVKLDEEERLIEELSKRRYYSDSDIVLLHISDITSFSYAEEQFVIEQDILKKLDLIKQHLIEKGFTGKISSVCEFSDHPKKHFIFYLHKTHPRLAVVFQTNKRVLLGSFIQYLLHKSAKSIMILKPSSMDLSEQHFHPFKLHGLNPHGGELRGN